MKQTTVFYRVIPGSEDKLTDWGKKLMTTFHNEAIASLKYEGLIQESLYLLSGADENYGLFISSHEGEIKPSNKNERINIEHRRILKETLKKCEDVPIQLINIKCIYRLVVTN